MQYAVIIEPTATGFSAHIPDLPGCVATGRTLEKVRDEIRSAAEFHIEGLRLHGYPVPAPSSIVESVEVAE